MIYFATFVFYSVLDPDPHWHTDLGPDLDAMKMTKKIGLVKLYLKTDIMERRCLVVT